MNNLIIIGRLGKDAEVKTVSGKNVINFSVAIDTGFGDRKETLWIDCAKWGEKTGVAQYLLKGTQVALTGEVGLRKWDSGAAITLRVSSLELVGGGKQQQYTEMPTGKVPIVPADEDQSQLPF